MSPPENAKAAPARGRLSDQMTTRATSNDKDTVPDVTGKRNTPAQLPIVLAATIYTPAYGMTMALVVPDDPCPACGFWHSHRIKYPAPVLVARKARCGQRYELALHAPRSRRNRRAA